MSRQARLVRELTAVQACDDENIVLELYDPRKHGGSYGRGGDVYLWHATLKGPEGTPYEGGTYSILLRVPPEYPMLPPTAFFITKIFHPNVLFENGSVCLDILKTQWSPAWSIRTIALAILVLFSEPEHSSPLNCDAANLLREGDQLGYASMVKYYAIMYAGAPELSWDE